MKKNLNEIEENLRNIYYEKVKKEKRRKIIRVK
jgi:hypothetical protein